MTEPFENSHPTERHSSDRSDIDRCTTGIATDTSLLRSFDSRNSRVPDHESCAEKLLREVHVFGYGMLGGISTGFRESRQDLGGTALRGTSAMALSAALARVGRTRGLMVPAKIVSGALALSFVSDVLAPERLGSIRDVWNDTWRSDENVDRNKHVLNEHLGRFAFDIGFMSVAGGYGHRLSNSPWRASISNSIMYAAELLRPGRPALAFTGGALEARAGSGSWTGATSVVEAETTAQIAPPVSMMVRRPGARGGSAPPAGSGDPIVRGAATVNPPTIVSAAMEIPATRLGAGTPARGSMDTGAGSRSISRVGETVPTSLAESQRVPPLGARTAGSDMRGASALVSVEDRARIAASEHIAPELAQIWQPSPPIARWEGGRLVPVVDTERNPQLRDFIEMINWFNRERPRTKYDGIYPYHTDGGDIYTGKGRTRASGYEEQLKYGHGLVGPALIAEISNPALTPRPIVDAFAGRGYLGWVMGKNGVPLVSFDCAPIGSGVNLRADLIPLSVAYPRQFGTRRSAPSGEAATGNEWFSEGVSWSRVLPGNESFLKLQNWNAGKYPQTMIISYPPDNTNDAARALYNFSGRHLIYLGQTPGGVTGTRDFFDLLDRNWKLTKILDNPHVPGYQDRVFIFDRLKPSQERTTPAKFDGQLTMKSLTGGYSSRPGRTQEWIVGLLPR